MDESPSGDTRFTQYDPGQAGDVEEPQSLLELPGSSAAKTCDVVVAVSCPLIPLDDRLPPSVQW
jgi:hypothetical protein